MAAGMNFLLDGLVAQDVLLNEMIFSSEFLSCLGMMRVMCKAEI